MQVTKGTWRMREQCEVASPAQEPRNEASSTPVERVGRGEVSRFGIGYVKSILLPLWLADIVLDQHWMDYVFLHRLYDIMMLGTGTY